MAKTNPDGTRTFLTMPNHRTLKGSIFARSSPRRRSTETNSWTHSPRRPAVPPPNNSLEPPRFAPGIFDRPGQPGVEFGAIRALAGRAAHLEAVRRRWRAPHQTGHLSSVRSHLPTPSVAVARLHSLLLFHPRGDLHEPAAPNPGSDHIATR